jgi:titin
VTPIELTVPSSAPVTDLPLGTPDGPVTSAAPGGKLKMSGRGYAPFSVVTLAVYSEPTVLGTVTADANGAFETEIDVPDNLSLGKHSFVAAGVDKNGNFRALRLDLTVAETPAGDDGKKLPVTGSAVLWMIVAGFASVVTGTALRRLAN